MSHFLFFAMPASFWSIPLLLGAMILCTYMLPFGLPTGTSSSPLSFRELRYVCTTLCTNVVFELRFRVIHTVSHVPALSNGFAFSAKVRSVAFAAQAGCNH